MTDTSDLSDRCNPHNAPSSTKNIDIKNSIRSAEKLIKGQGRILVRSSGTESKIRVMGESDNIKLLQKCLKIVLRKIK